MDVIRRGILIGYVAKLNSGLGGVSTRRKLSGNTTLPTTTTRVVGTFQMVFTNLIMTPHVNRMQKPLMSSMAIRRYKSVDVANPKGGYQKSFAITAPILDHKDGHYVKPSMVALKYLDF
jgi:hypothetical protein